VVHRIAVAVLASIGLSACAPREDPARAELRARLSTEAQLSADEIARVFEEVNRTIEGKRIRIVRGSTASEIGAAEREVALGMLIDRTGVFDEGLRAGGGRRARVFNAPGQSNNPEIEANRRLFIDLESFEPLRFEFAYAFSSPEDYEYEIDVE
jgi:hypothetical protein